MAWVMIRVSEIWLKSAKTRAALMRRLVSNIDHMLSRAGLDFEIKQFGPRLLVNVEKEHLGLEIISRVFGVKSVSPGFLVESTPEQIEYAVLKLIDQLSGTFRVSVNRGWKGFKYTSPEFERILGSRILEVKGASLKVDLKNPDTTIGVDIREDFTFIYTGTVQGPGGLPYGSQGKVLALFSGGIDSPVASWMIAKRGAEVDHLFINICCKDLEEKVLKVFDALSSWYPSTSLYVARLPGLREEITRNVREGYRQIVYKAIMYKIANQLADNLSSKVIVTGESLGQVSTQTLTNLTTLSYFSKRPIFRPLIGMDKDEVVRISRNIGLYSVSSAVPEVCKLESHSRTNIPIDMARKLLANSKINIDDFEFVKLR